MGSTLSAQNLENIYRVPEGYFDGLAEQILNRIKAIEVNNAKEELQYLSPLLAGISRKTPYTVPDGYFKNLSEALLYSINETAGIQTSEEEIETLSPVLGSLKNRNPYSLPVGYFENLKPVAEKKGSKVISIASRRWYRMVAAAVVIGIITIGGLLFIKGNQVDPNQNPVKWISKNVTKKVSKDKIDEFVKLTEEEDRLKVSAENNTVSTEIKELMKDVPEKEIQEFLNDAVALGSNNADDLLMN
jgi:hypothetical protein